jgi:hypothetical protein
MKYNKKTNCIECGCPLNLQDMKETRWENDYLEFVFVCCSCKKENIVKSKLFRNEHISRNFLKIIKEDKSYLPADKLNLLHNHLEKCEECRNKFNEEYLLEVEEKIRFNEYSLKCLNNNGQEIKKELTSDSFSLVDGQVKSFFFENKKYDTDEDFFKQDTKICYYLKNGNELTVGLACLEVSNEKVIIHKIWLISDELLKKEQELIQKIKKNDKIKLETLIKIYHSLDSSLKNME